MNDRRFRNEFRKTKPRESSDTDYELVLQALGILLGNGKAISPQAAGDAVKTPAKGQQMSTSRIPKTAGGGAGTGPIIKPIQEERSRQMKLAELARRYLDNPKARGNDTRDLLEAHDLMLVKGRKNMYTISLEGLDLATRKRMTRLAYPTK